MGSKGIHSVHNITVVVIADCNGQDGNTVYMRWCWGYLNNNTGKQLCED